MVLEPPVVFSAAEPRGEQGSIKRTITRATKRKLAYEAPKVCPGRGFRRQRR
jgi:hypothetical protein